MFFVLFVFSIIIIIFFSFLLDDSTKFYFMQFFKNINSIKYKNEPIHFFCFNNDIPHFLCNRFFFAVVASFVFIYSKKKRIKRKIFIYIQYVCVCVFFHYHLLLHQIFCLFMHHGGGGMGEICSSSILNFFSQSFFLSIFFLYNYLFKY